MKLPRLQHRSPENTKPEDKKADQASTPQDTEPKKTETTIQKAAPRIEPKTKKGLYVYCIMPADSPADYGRIGVKDDALVHTIKFKDIAAVVSDFDGDSFEKTDSNVLAHQRVVHKVFEQRMGIPVRFGTIREDENEVRAVLEEGYADFTKQLGDLTPKAGEESMMESSAPTDIIAEILSQSAASAVRIRQLADTLDTVRRQEYEKGAAKLPEGTARELLDFLAKAPPGAYQTSSAPTASTEQIQTLERRLDTLFEEINHLKDMVSTSQTDPNAIAEFQKEQEKIKEAVMGFRALQNENKSSLEKTVSQAIKEQMAKMSPAKQLMLDVAGKEEPQVQPLLGASVSPSLPESIQSYTRCPSCGAGIVITDRFCAHCGKPNIQNGT